jgi:predicted MFS family arabinose efflux permease
MPLTHLLIGAIGWRQTLLVLGGLNLAICLPLHALCVPGAPASRPHATPMEDAPTAPAIRAVLRGPVFVGLALWFTAYNAAQTAFIFQLVPLLTAWRVETAAILTSVALIGPMQVAGRVVVMCFSTRLETREMGLAATVLLPAALLALLALPHTVSELIGRTHYGAINGALTVPTTVAKALAPVVAAVLWSAGGDPSLMLWTILGSALVGQAGLAMALAGAAR